MMQYDSRLIERREKQNAITSLRKHLWNNPELRYLFLELTDRCNLQCLHCGSSCSERNKEYLDADKVIEIVRSVSEYEPRVHICLTGGEPLLYPEFKRITKELAKTHVFWSLVTNATLVNDDIASLLEETGAYSVSVSLDGDVHAHNKLRQSETAYDRAIQGICCLRRHDIPVQITTVVNKDNLYDLEIIFEKVKKLGACSWKLVNMEPIGRARERGDMLLTRREFLYLLDYIRLKRKQMHDLDEDLNVTYGCSHLLPIMYEEEVRTSLFLCGAGTMIAGIQSNGDIAACLDIERRDELVQGNVYLDDFVNVWENRFQAFRRDRTEDSTMCQSCSYKETCAGDSFHTWDFEHRRPRMCLMQYSSNISNSL